MKRVALVAAALSVAAAIIASITTFNASAAGERRLLPETDLVINYSPGPQAPMAVWTLHCGAKMDVHPDAARACAHLHGMPPRENPFAPVPPGVMCTMIVGGPDRATITGHWRGKLIRATFDLTNG